MLLGEAMLAALQRRRQVRLRLLVETPCGACDIRIAAL